MSRLTIRWTKRALRRLDTIGAHIAKENPQAAERVIARIISAVDALAGQPAMGRVGRLKGTREMVLPDFPYIIPYRVVRTDLEVLTVMHSAQQWPSEL